MADSLPNQKLTHFCCRVDAAARSGNAKCLSFKYRIQLNDEQSVSSLASDCHSTALQLFDIANSFRFVGTLSNLS